MQEHGMRFTSIQLKANAHPASLNVGEGVAGNQCGSLLCPVPLLGQPHAPGYQGLYKFISS